MPNPLPPRKKPRRKPGEADQKDSKGGGRHEKPAAQPASTPKEGKEN